MAARANWFQALVALAAAVLAVTGALIALWRLGQSEDAAIDRERARRLSVVALGQRLAGTPDLGDLAGRLAAHGVKLGTPVFLRIFKREFEFELWVKRDDRFHLFATYPVCRWSGGLGPKVRQGDRQAPEGFYTVTARALNPNSRWHRSFDLGFPNALDRGHGRTGTYLMVHGGCSSIGCFAMTDPVIDEIWRLVTAALKGGQRQIHVHVFPFRMTQANLEHRATSPWLDFWRDLKQGHDAFEATWLPPRMTVCGGRYVVEASASSAGAEASRPACAAASSPAAHDGKS